jgi:hypothetical protein
MTKIRAVNVELREVCVVPRHPVCRRTYVYSHYLRIRKQRARKYRALRLREFAFRGARGWSLNAKVFACRSPRRAPSPNLACRDNARELIEITHGNQLVKRRETRIMKLRLKRALWPLYLKKATACRQRSYERNLSDRSSYHRDIPGSIVSIIYGRIERLFHWHEKQSSLRISRNCRREFLHFYFTLRFVRYHLVTSFVCYVYIYIYIYIFIYIRKLSFYYELISIFRYRKKMKYVSLSPLWDIISHLYGKGSGRLTFLEIRVEEKVTGLF